MTDAVTKADLLATETELKNELASKVELRALRSELAATREELKEEIRFLGARFENLESIVKAFGEGLLGLREHVTEEIRTLRKELSSRIAVLEEVVRNNSGDLQEVKAGVADLRRRFDRLERENDLEKRVAEVEKRLGIR
ncbi:MAG TPA: hypothetical protein VH054_28235 [Polyangiaceae bacterium]|jgi:DNA repair exonuclease SbcCD ATPase subunit|nr:hypothetical protein [Polyangiaceae bacterium]